MSVRVFLIILFTNISFSGYAFSNNADTHTKSLSYVEEDTNIDIYAEPDSLTETTLQNMGSLFPILQTFPKNFEELCRLPTTELPYSIVSRNLLQIKNSIEYRHGRSVTYYAIGQITYNSNLFLLYAMEDGPYEYEIYLCQYPENNSYPTTLKIYQTINGGSEINFSIDNGEIVLLEYSQVSEIPVLQRYTYKLDSNFTQIGEVETTRTKRRYTWNEIESIPCP
ncbi:MAG: hypothetical protein ACI30P_02410 [Muribaculaceae bacterium]